VELMQLCEVCTKEKPKRNVHRNRNTKKLTCSACAEKEYRIKRPEAQRLASKNWRLRNPEKCKRQNSTWSKKNPQKRYAIRRNYYQSVFLDPKNTRNAYESWTLGDLQLIIALDRPSDRTLSAQIGRSISAIQIQRFHQNKKEVTSK